MPPVIAFVGKPDCGKTTLLEKLPPELNRRGLKVGASDPRPEGDLPWFGLDEIVPLADFLVARLPKQPTSPHTTLLVDGRQIELNSFVEQFLARTVAGMTSSLRGCDQAREITITVRPVHADR